VSETWDGRPPGDAAERDGWHWLDGDYTGSWMQPAFWRHEYSDWMLAGRGYSTDATGMRGFRYVAPCDPPDKMTSDTTVGWHPISTAPAYRRVVLWWRDGALSTSYITPGTAEALGNAGATHWMIPEPPHAE